MNMLDNSIDSLPNQTPQILVFVACQHEVLFLVRRSG